MYRINQAQETYQTHSNDSCVEADAQEYDAPYWHVHVDRLLAIVDCALDEAGGHRVRNSAADGAGDDIAAGDVEARKNVEVEFGNSHDDSCEGLSWCRGRRGIMDCSRRPPLRR
jgi:hypothetical protein